MAFDELELAVLAALAADPLPLTVGELLLRLPHPDARAQLARLQKAAYIALKAESIHLLPRGVERLMSLHQEIEAALDPSPTTATMEECPSLPWLTTVQTHWIDAVSINYAVPPAALARLLPAPLEPEIWKGSAWVQVLMSSLRDMRPQGLTSLFGFCFYQVSYRAAIQYPSVDGTKKRGGYFVRSETNDPLMRRIGNLLAEFRFHDFGAADMTMLRDGPRLTLGVDPVAERPHGRVVALLNTGRPTTAPPKDSVWDSLAELHTPLVECYDALGVDRAANALYVLTIDRDPWNARFVELEHVYCEYLTDGPLAGSRLDSVLHFAECGYRWRPLRKEPLCR